MLTVIVVLVLLVLLFLAYNVGVTNERYEWAMVVRAHMDEIPVPVLREMQKLLKG